MSDFDRVGRAISQLPARDQRGSRVRCLLLTEGSNDDVASRLTALASPWASVDPTDNWRPRGISSPGEAQIGRDEGFLEVGIRSVFTEWWLAVPQGANTPNWDIASTATIGGREGLLLVEAKAHDAELKIDGKPTDGNPKNHERIERAIREASNGLNGVLPGRSLSADSHYQLANRFAWAWKIASLGIPVVLVYLGFLGSTEMEDRGRPFPDSEAWEELVRAHGIGVVPNRAWDEPMSIGGTTMRAVITSIRIDLPHQG